MSREPKRIRRKATAEEREKYARLRAQLEKEKPEILAEGRKLKAAHNAAVGSLREAFGLLREERNRRGMSLRDLAERTGIVHSALSRLETDPEANPTILTRERCAAALGKKLKIVLEESSA